MSSDNVVLRDGSIRYETFQVRASIFVCLIGGMVGPMDGDVGGMFGLTGVVCRMSRHCRR